MRRGGKSQTKAVPGAGDDRTPAQLAFDLAVADYPASFAELWDKPPWRWRSETTTRMRGLAIRVAELADVLPRSDRSRRARGDEIRRVAGWARYPVQWDGKELRAAMLAWLEEAEVADMIEEAPFQMALAEHVSHVRITRKVAVRRGPGRPRRTTRELQGEDLAAGIADAQRIVALHLRDYFPPRRQMSRSARREGAIPRSRADINTLASKIAEEWARGRIGVRLDDPAGAVRSYRKRRLSRRSPQ